MENSMKNLGMFLPKPVRVDGAKRMETSPLGPCGASIEANGGRIWLQKRFSVLLIALFVAMPFVAMKKEKTKKQKRKSPIESTSGTIHKCPTCSYETKHRSLFDVHLSAHPSHACPTTSVPEPDHFLAHQCPACYLLFYTQAECELHIKTHLARAPTTFFVSCKSCTQSFINKSHCMEHVENEHIYQTEKKSDYNSPDIDNDKLICPTCQESLDGYRGMDIHILTHLKFDDLPACSTSDSTPSPSHSPAAQESNPYACFYKDCAQTFTEKDSWIRHMENEHYQNSAQIVANDAPQPLLPLNTRGTRRTMVQHYIHKSEQPQLSSSLFCYRCEKSFESNQEFEAHIEHCFAWINFSH
jgi:hypothetical protein